MGQVWGSVRRNDARRISLALNTMGSREFSSRGAPARAMSAMRLVDLTRRPYGVPGVSKKNVRKGLAGLAHACPLVATVLATTAPTAAPRPLNCNGTYEGMSVTNLTVLAGQNCTFAKGTVSGNVQQSGGNLRLVQSRVAGNVQVKGGGTFAIGPNSTIGGNLEIHNLPIAAGTNTVCGTSVGGNLQFHNNGSAVLIGSADPGSCAGNTVGGNLEVHNNSAATAVVANAVTGNWTTTTMPDRRRCSLTRSEKI